MKILKWILVLIVIGCIGWTAKWYIYRPALPTVEQVAGTIVTRYRGNKTLDGGTPLVKVSVSRVRDIQRVGYSDFIATADVTMVFQRDPFIPGNEYTGAARGMGEKDTVGKDVFKIPRKKGENIKTYLPIGTTRKLRDQSFKIYWNKAINFDPISGRYSLSGQP